MFLAGVAGGFLQRRDSEVDNLLKHNGLTWMRQPDGDWLRWNADEQRWDDVGPPPPEVVKELGRGTSNSRTGPAHTVLVVAALTLVGLFTWAFFDPRAQIPWISEVVCSIKGNTWYDQSALIEPGCYQRDVGEDF